MDEPACPGCRELLRRLDAAERRIAELEARLGQNASNSSLPPSANPPAAPKPVVKTPTGRPSGAQPGHEPHLRQRLPSDRVTRVVRFVPTELRRHAVGPRLAAFLAYLRGAHQVSQRGLEEIVETALGVPLSLGTINRLEQQTSAALAPAHAAALQAVRAAPVKHVDETG